MNNFSITYGGMYHVLRQSIFVTYIYEQGPPTPPPTQPDGSPPPVAGEGGFSQQPST